jgi:hypothetical protein
LSDYGRNPPHPLVTKADPFCVIVYQSTKKLNYERMRLIKLCYKLSSNVPSDLWIHCMPVRGM